jgi:glucose-6-phosphate 1-epimerase
METISLQTADGAVAELYLHGAHLTSWRPAGGEERLFLSGRSAFRAGTAIRGGVPVVFPQFAGEGPLPKHGFARTTNWRLIESGAGHAKLALEDSAATRALWPHGFACELDVSLGGARLAVELSVSNRGGEAFEFTAALHTYLRVRDIAAARVIGLQGLRYRDSVRQRSEHREAAAELAIEGEVDRVYFDAPAELVVTEADRRLRLIQAGFADTVVWNPGAELGAALADLEAEGYRRMLCVEAAAIGRPIALAPGARWHGSQTLVAE